MKKLFFFTFLSMFLIHKVQAVESVDPVFMGHPIVGTWVRDKSGCLAQFTFKPNGTRLVQANQEIVKARYHISDISRENGIYLLRDTVLEDNGKPDCSGSSSDMTGDTVEVLLFIQSNPTRFSFCFDEQLKQCIGPYVKEN